MAAGHFQVVDGRLVLAGFGFGHGGFYKPKGKGRLARVCGHPHLCSVMCARLALMKRIIIQGAMNHASGAEMTKLLTITAGTQKKAWDMSAGMLKTAIMPTPKTAAFTMQ